MEVVKEFVVKGYVDANFDTNPDDWVVNRIRIVEQLFEMAPSSAW